MMSSVATELDFTKDGFYIDFPKMLGYIYGDIKGSEAHLCFVRTSPAGGVSSKEMSSSWPASAAPAQAAGENGALPAEEPPTPPAGEGAEAVAGDPAPCEAPRRALRLLS